MKFQELREIERDLYIDNKYFNNNSFFKQRADRGKRNKQLYYSYNNINENSKLFHN